MFIYLSIIGAFLMNLSIQAFIGENKSSSCILRPWAIDISSNVLFRVSKKLKKIKIPDYKVALQVVGLCCVDLVILILWPSRCRSNRPGRTAPTACCSPSPTTPALPL